MQRNFVRLISIIFLFSLSHLVCAEVDQNMKLWTKAGINGYLSKQHHLKYLVDGQLRFVSQRRQFEQGVFEAMLGYAYSPTLDFWIAYKRYENEIHSAAPHRNMIFQEVSWKFFTNEQMKWTSRSRFEQQRPTNFSQWLLRVRQRFKGIFPLAYKKNVVPAFWNEFFFNLNNTPYATHDFYSQNRLFIGFDIDVTPTQHFEIGYMNQLVFNSETNKPDEVNHVLYMDYNFDMN